ncbi:Ig-like domain-containing protein [Ottowia thiooxydans]|uniref:Ig-like domain-containing protein n=1 Tax=Ottowia thiooxydans TaxID=219182 RepID=UPI00056904F7
MSFSRGGPALLFFAELLDKQGIPDPRTAYTVEVPGRVDGVWVQETHYSGYLVPPGAKLSALMVDPVASGVVGVPRLPNNILRLHVDYAGNEPRTFFAPMSFSDPRNPDPRVTETWWPGAHSTFMAAYEKTGVSAAYDIHARHVLFSMGVPTGAIPAKNAYLPETALVHDSAVGLFTSTWAPTRRPTEHWALTSFQKKPKPGIEQDHPTVDELTGTSPSLAEGVTPVETPESVSADSGPLPTADMGQVDTFGPPLNPGTPWPPFTEASPSSAPAIEASTTQTSESNTEAPATTASEDPAHWVIADSGTSVLTDGGPLNSYGDHTDSSTYKAPPTINDLIPDFVPEAGSGSSSTPQEWADPQEAPQPEMADSGPLPATNVGPVDSFGPPIGTGAPQPSFTDVPEHTPPTGQAPSPPALISADAAPTPSTPEQPPAPAGGTSWGLIPRENLNNPYGYTPDFTEPEAAPASEGQAFTAIAPAKPLTPAELAGRNAQTAASTFTTMLSTLNGWEEMTPVQRAAAIVAVGNSLASLSGNTIGPAGAGLKLGSMLGLAAALERGDLASAVVNGLQAIDTITQTATTAGIVSQAGVHILPFLNLVLAVRSGEATAVTNAALGMYTAVNPASVAWTGPVGFVIAIIGIAMMSGERTPIAGWSEFTLDESGQLSPLTTFNQEDGGDISHSATERLIESLQTLLDLLLDDEGKPMYAVNPARLPQIGYWYSPDSMMYQNNGDSLLLRWVDAHGETVTRFYDGKGERADGSNENIGQDFMRLAQQAIVPAWLIEGAVPAHTRHLQAAAALEAQAQNVQEEADAIAPPAVQVTECNEGTCILPVPSSDPVRYEALNSELAHLQGQALAERDQARDLLAQLPTSADLEQKPEIHGDGTQSIRVLTIPVDQGTSDATALTQPNVVLMDIDGDGYFERTHWIAPGQAVLAVDLDGDGRITGEELLNADLSQLDANHDGRIDAQDPGYRAVRVWKDVNGDGQVQYAPSPNGALALPPGEQGSAASELSTLPEAGITAITYEGGHVTVERVDGSIQPVQEQTITGTVLGLRYQIPTEGAVGVVRIDEQIDGSGVPTLMAANTGVPQTTPPTIAPPAPEHAPEPPPHVNHDPVANDDGFHGLEDVAMEISVEQLLINDWDQDTAYAGDVLRVSAVGDALNGSATLEAGQVVFRPDPDFFGIAQFRYWISDDRGGSASAVAYMNFTAVNDPPVIEGIIFDTTQNRWAQNPSVGDLFRFKDPTVETGWVVAHDFDTPGPLKFELAAAPIHGHASIDETSGVWGYRTEYIDPYQGPDPFSVRVKDAEGAATVVQVQTSHVRDQQVRLQDKKPIGWTPPPPGPNVNDAMYAPVVIDLDGDGLQLLDAGVNPVHLDMNGDGVADQVGWVAPQDAFLALDRDGDGQITRLDELSFIGDWPGAQTDLEGLQGFDTNGDGLLSEADERWHDFGLFQDLNSNGLQDEGEFTPIAETDIVAISLTRQGEPYYNNGNLVMGVSTVWMADGSTRDAGDVMLQVIDGAKQRASSISAAEHASASLDQQVSQQVDQLLSAMAGFAPKPAGEVCLAEEYQASLRIELAVGTA